MRAHSQDDPQPSGHRLPNHLLQQVEQLFIVGHRLDRWLELTPRHYENHGIESAGPNHLEIMSKLTLIEMTPKRAEIRIRLKILDGPELLGKWR